MSSPHADSKEEQTAPQPPKKVKVRLWHILFLLVLVAASLSLAWWQWTRFRSGSGTFQNLGYAFQWPIFGAFFVYAYRKILEYENDKYSLENGIDPDDPQSAPPMYESPTKNTEISEDFLPARPQLSVEEFNALNKQERKIPRNQPKNEE